jgi:hypothetical protein
MGRGEEDTVYCFLLGGYDLEMLEIRKILEAEEQMYIDLKLAWGAKLSAYSAYLNDTGHFVGIELVEDMEKPRHYKAIDHHNEYSGNPSAIEQVADLLNIELNWYQKLVAANDKSYIGGMDAMGATQDEIAEIRKADREAQGVTAYDEEMAKKSIKHYLERLHDLLLVEALTPRFSAITDRLYPFRKLLITFQDQLVYYGEGKEKIVKNFDELIKQGKAYHGGTKNGFFGLVNGAFTIKETREIRNIIIGLITKGSHV